MTTSASQRYHANSLDILKGCGLLALVVMNCINWYVAVPLPGDIYGIHTSIIDVGVRRFTDYFLSGQWYSFLAFLLGIQFFNSSKRERRQQRSDYFRRYLILLLLGLMHQFLWPGDILIIYAISGMLLVLFEKLGANVSLVVGLLFISNLPGLFLSLFLQLLMGKPPGYSPASATENANYIAQLLETGNIKQFLSFNVENVGAKYKYNLLSGQFFRVSGFYILGYYAGRINFLQQVKDKSRFFGITLMILGFCFLSVLYLDVSLFWGSNNLVMDAVKGMVTNMEHILGAASYLLAGLLLLQFDGIRRVLKITAPAGHIWLSGYLFQTLTGLLLYYPIGLGLYPKSGPAQNLLIALVIFFFQIIFSQIWLHYFRYGPIEWLWRSGAAYRWRRMWRR